MDMTDDIVVLGGGPAGMLAGLLFARAGLRTRVLEKHGDFLRDFRGDTVHPSTMEILDQIGLLDEFLERPHNRVTNAVLRVAGTDYELGDLSHLATPAPFIAMMPQWHFLDFLKSHAERLPSFALEMEAEGAAFVEEAGRIAGVRLADGSERRARLTIAADGRGSLVRGMLPLRDVGAPMDVLWFGLPKVDDGGDVLRGGIADGHMLILIDRDDYWQCAFVVPKGAAFAGLDSLRQAIGTLFPEIAIPADTLLADDEVKRLSVALDRLERWHRPGLLAIGDAAHAMSPVGGVGINLAIQDAVAAANALAGPIAGGLDPDQRLHRVQARREVPVRMVQAAQRFVQDRLIVPALAGELTEAPAAMRLLDRFAPLRRLPGRMIGLGVRRERVRSPKA